MADNRQFGSPKVLQFGDIVLPGGAQSESQYCSQCEAMLTDALDGTLSADEQTLFDSHTVACGACSQMLADARRGAAWLEMLRDPRPEPLAELLDRILFQTSGKEALGVHAASLAMHELPGADKVPAVAFSPAVAARSYSADFAAFGKVLPFRNRVSSFVRSSGFGEVILQPRLAMTAAMAFFSIALTLNLTGVRLQDLRASDLKPGSIKRDLSSANARVAKYYEGLRVVYELESRVHDLQTGADGDSGNAAGASGRPGPAQAPAVTPAPADREPESQPVRTRPVPKSGTSRRDELFDNRQSLASVANEFLVPSPLAVHALIPSLTSVAREEAPWEEVLA